MSRVPRDDYYVMMWSFVDPLFVEGPEKAALAIRRFRELACNSGTLIATFVDLDGYRQLLADLGLPPIAFRAEDLNTFPFLDHEFPFYVENIVRPLYRNWNEFKPIYKRQYEAFARDRDPRVFVSPPCLNDPRVMDLTRGRIVEVMKRLEPARRLTLLYDLRDEPSITSFLLASDSCFCEHCLTRMREWLKTRYADLGALNCEWGTAFAGWEAVVPLATQEALERRDAGVLNFAPWADHREFMNETFARVCRDLAEEIRRHDPEALVGLAGTQCPSVFGGYDFSRLVPVLDWAEPYDFGGSLDCFRSFKPRRAFPILKTSGLGGSDRVAEALLWTYVFQSGGYAGTIVWNSNTVVDLNSKTLKPTRSAQERAEVYAELRSGIPKLLQVSHEVTSPVAVHYSQASINADFITAVPKRWRSVAAYESHEFLAHECRTAWWTLLEDRGLRPRFISSGEIENGALAGGGVKVLILPRSIAVSDLEAVAMREFVEAGGTLVADSFAGRMDEHCRERERGVLDDLFGVRRLEGGAYAGGRERGSYSLDAKPGARPRWGGGPGRISLPEVEDDLEVAPEAAVLGSTEMTDSPIGIIAVRGKGRAMLVNGAPVEYLVSRRRPGGARGLTAFFGAFLDGAGLTPELQVFPRPRGAAKRLDGAAALPGWRVWRFAHGAATYFGLAPDMEVVQDTLGAIRGGADEKKPVKVVVRLAARGHLYEARSGRYLGRGNMFADALDSTSTRVYAVMPYRVLGLTLTFKDGVAGAAVKRAGRAAAGAHVFRFDLFDAKGRRLLDAGANVVAAAGAGQWRPEGALPKRGRLVCRDVATGIRAAVRL